MYAQTRSWLVGSIPAAIDVLFFNYGRMEPMKISKSHYDRLDQRRLWLTNRIEAKEKTGWETQYDESERDALAAALAALEVDTAPDPGDGWRIAEGEDWKDERCEIWLGACGRWEIRHPEEACTRFDDVSTYRVPIDPAPKHPPVPEGWRVVDKDEPLQEGDQFSRSETYPWSDSCGDELGRDPFGTYIRRIEPTYRPFASAEEFRPHRDRWWKYKAGVSFNPPCEYNDIGHMADTWEESLGVKVFDDGSPFGVEVK